MSLAVLALMAWFVLLVFGMVPKGLSLLDLVFLYFVIVIMTIAVFTTLDANLHWVPLTRSVEGALAMYICRFFFIPPLVLLAVCVLLSRLKTQWRIALSATIVFILSGADWVYLRLELMEYERWNAVISILMYGVFVILIWRIARWYIGFGKEVLSQS
ncbi:hypothetical protein FE782_00605 [Paenibacillus antri]|uniref:Uncharacterized protein n=1 Tax=Paenibacillus antri TaxID=2582848 RepID=A0A5R9GDQ5_9BACL|nr:hypothetical protein FE782_00605 [Paenibacillus antri]